MRDDRRRAAAHKRILEVLTAHPMTQHELSDTLFMSRTSVYLFLKQLRDPKNRKVRIAAWETEPSNYVPIYRAGTGPDAKRPKARTRAELRLRALAKKPQARKDPLISWIPRKGERIDGYV